MRKSRILPWVAVPLFAALLASCSAIHHARSRATTAGDIASRHQRVDVQSAVVARGELTTLHAASGTVDPVTQSKVAARVAGVVEAVYQQAGAWVKQDQTVVQLDDSQLRLAVESAQAALETAKVNLQKARGEMNLANLTLTRDKSLIKKDLIPQSQLDVDSTNAESAGEDFRAAHAAMDQANVQLKQAQLNLEYASIRAPFAGQLAAVNVSEGEFVGQDTPVFVLASPQRQIDFSVPPDDAATLSKGAAVGFAFEGRTYAAYVSEAPSTPINGVVPIVARFRSGAQTLPYGSVGSVSYRLDLARAIIVPISAVQTSGNENYVFAVVDGKAKTQTVDVLAESGTNAAVDGISSGTRVIVNPPPGLLPGASVSTTQSGTTNG